MTSVGFGSRGHCFFALKLALMFRYFSLNAGAETKSCVLAPIESTELLKQLGAQKQSPRLPNPTECFERSCSILLRCKNMQPCLIEKLQIINVKSESLLNKRSELISKCRHKNKFWQKNVD